MKSIAGLFLLFAVAGCIDLNTRANDDGRMAQTTACDRSTRYGNVEICLPEIAGMVECYDHPKVKPVADYYEYKDNDVLAYYLNEETYASAHRLADMAYDDYFKIYAVKKLAGVSVSNAEFRKNVKDMTGGLLRKNWDSIRGKVLDSHQIAMDQPVVIEEYALKDDVVTLILLMNYPAADGGNTITIGALNILRIRNRLVCMAYYRHYDGMESVANAKAKNDYIALKIMEVNG